jgi:transaldolase/fructose-6-phosphate aldolase-like protein
MWQVERVVDGKPTLTPLRVSLVVTKRGDRWLTLIGKSRWRSAAGPAAPSSPRVLAPARARSVERAAATGSQGAVISRGAARPGAPRSPRHPRPRWRWNFRSGEDALPARAAEQATIHLVRPLRDRNAELIAQRLRHSTRDRRVPKEGLPAIEEAIFAGIPINVTLLFSHEHYLAAADAFLRGIERRVAAGLQPEVGSVASVFISRWCRGS